MKIKLFQNWDQKLLAGIYRFPISIILAIVYASFVARSIHISTFEIGHNIVAFFITGFFLSVVIALSVEDKIRSLVKSIVISVVTLLWLLFWLSQPRKFDGDDMIYFSVMTLIAFVLAIFWSSYLKRDNNIPFWNFTVHTIIRAIISCIFAGVLMGGISLAVQAVDVLFKAQISHDIYSYLAIVCFILFGPIYFLSNIPSGKEKYDDSLQFNTFLKIFSLYIVLPILFIYTAILYAYLVKIIIQWQLPNGWVSWLVSVLGVVGFVTIMLIHPLCEKKENKSGLQFARYFPVVILPLLVLMTIGVFRRFNDYGLTINRMLVIMLNFWMYGVAIYFIITKSRRIKMVFISFSVITFLAAVGPWNIFTITHQSIYTHLKQILDEHHILTNGNIDFAKPRVNKLDSVTFFNIESALRYMCITFGVNSVQPLFEEKLTRNRLFILLDDMQSSYLGKGLPETEMVITPPVEPILTEGFPCVIQISFKIRGSVSGADGKLTISLERNTLALFKDRQPYITIPLVDEIARLKLLRRQHRINTIDATTIRGSNFKFIITHLEVELIHQPRISQLEGILFYR